MPGSPSADAARNGTRNAEKCFLIIDLVIVILTALHMHVFVICCLLILSVVWLIEVTIVDK